ncbi:MAG: type II toxin-antitoxin system death-on-curing family toxin [Ruminococcus sp.]|nr:type II toxin-antitoxin system death-on-curing family toxin [Ruminococcus sp.]
MKYLTKQVLIRIHNSAIEEFGGDFGLRDDGLLEAALAAPLASFGGADLFPTVIEKAARLALGIIKNHPFIDGNKRTGILALYFLVLENGYYFKDTVTNDETYNLGIGLAEGTIDIDNLLIWLENNIYR